MTTVPLFDEQRLIELIQDPCILKHAWAEYASCRGVDADAYFPENGQVPSNQAMSRCARCPVAEKCLASTFIYEASDNARHGWWGGLGPAQREVLWSRLAPHLQHLPQPILHDAAAIARALRKEHWTVTAIACELGCTERTIYRYLAASAA
jgi:hypothetical protein